MMLRWLLILVCMTVAPEAAADEFTVGQQHYRAGSYQQARDLWAPLAEKGNPAAQYSLGVLYERGEAVEADILAAAKWYARAAAQGYEPAVTALRSLAPALIEKRDEMREKKKMESDKADKGKQPGPPQPKQKPAKQASRSDSSFTANILVALAFAQPTRP